LRDFHLAEHGLHVLRFSDHDVLRNPEGVLNRIYEEVSHRLKLNPALKETPSQSPPRGEEDDNLQPGNGMPLPL